VHLRDPPASVRALAVSGRARHDNWGRWARCAHYLLGLAGIGLVAWLALAGVAHARGEPWLGVWIDGALIGQPATSGVPQETVYITVINQGGPAEAAGLQPLDIIHEIDGRRMRTVRDVVCVIQAARPSQIVLVTVLRLGTMRTVPVMLAEWPPQH